MSLTPHPTRVLIIGAGVGGLALAHGLAQAGIAFHVFERDAASSPRAQGYRFRINPVGASALHSVLPPSVWPQFERSCGALPKGMAKLDACPGQPEVALHRPPPPPTCEGFKPYNADRTAFRQLLIDTLGEHVSYSKRCVGVEERQDGVTATFDDGSVETGSMLVGADGVRSAVRTLCFAGIGNDSIEPVDTQARCIYGKTPLTPATESLFSDDLRSKTLFVQDRTRGATVSLYLEPMRFDRDSASGEQHPDDYVYWVLGAPRSIFFGSDAAADEPVLSHEQAADLALSVTAHWDSAVRVAVEQQDRAQTALLRMMTAVPRRIASWPAGTGADVPVGTNAAAGTSSSRRVTLLGDAIHVMPPAGGNGANTALRDAALLAGLLVEAKRSGELEGRLGEVLARFEDEMKLYASEAVAGAGGAGKWMFDQPSFEELEVLAAEIRGGEL